MNWPPQLLSLSGARDWRWIRPLIASIAWILAAAEMAAQPLPSAPLRSLTQVRSNLSGLSREQIRQAAEAGQPQAEYYWGVLERQAADRDFGQLRSVWISNEMVLERTNISSGWKSNLWSEHTDAEVLDAAKSGKLDAQYILRQRALTLNSRRKAAAFEWIRKASQHSVAPAEYEVAVSLLYADGSGGQEAWTDGLRLLRLAAEHQSPAAQVFLAQLLLDGVRTPCDINLAVEWLRRAADGDSPDGCYGLACQYAAGNAEPRSSDDSPASLLLRAATAGQPQAQFELAERYRTGLGVERDLMEAIRWYCRAGRNVESPDPEIQRSAWRVLSLVDAQGRPVGTDVLMDPAFLNMLGVYVQAVRWKNVGAQNALGDLYLSGRGVRQNSTKAFYWFDLAAGQGSAIAARRREKLKPSLSPEEWRQVLAWAADLSGPMSGSTTSPMPLVPKLPSGKGGSR